MSAVFLGRTREGEKIYADVRIDEPKEGECEYTDHTVAPRSITVGIMFTVIDKHAPDRPLELVPDGYWRSSGQVPPEDRVIVGASASTRIIERVWKDWHLNDVNAACDHMTPAILNPSDEVLDEYIRVKTEERGEWREKYSPAFYGRADALQKWRLDNAVCPETGYRWGHKWLAKRIPDYVVEQLRLALREAPTSPKAVGR
jgi:hypothetical protein